MNCRIAVLILAISVFAVFSPAATKKSAGADDFLAGWAEALEGPDVDKIMEYYDNSETTVLITSDGYESVGTSEIQELYENLYAKYEIKSVELEDIITRIVGNFGWVTCTFKAQMVDKSDGASWDLEVRTTLVLLKSNTGWKIVQEHSSPIPGEHKALPAE